MIAFAWQTSCPEVRLVYPLALLARPSHDTGRSSLFLLAVSKTQSALQSGPGSTCNPQTTKTHRLAFFWARTACALAFFSSAWRATAFSKSALTSF